MLKSFFLPVITVGLVAGAALAHTNVANPAVKARMGAMMEISDDVKTLVRMSRGEIAFDGTEATAAFARIVSNAEAVPDLFEASETDPASEAAPDIWENWDDFVSRAEALKVAAEAGAGVPDAAALGSAMQEVAGTCRDCHDRYKL